MSELGNITELKTSWTKYDCVQVIEIIGSNELDLYLNGQKQINSAVLKAYLGINDFTDPLPEYWNRIQEFPMQKKLFALAAGIFTHHDNIKWFSDIYSKKNMAGVFEIGDAGKHKTNLRSSLVVSGASNNSYRKKLVVPYDLSILFEEGEVGLFFKELLIERLLRVGYSKKYLESDFYNICLSLNFHKALSLSEDQFVRWTEGKRTYQIKVYSYDLQKLAPQRKVPTLKVKQWLSSWDDINFDLPMRRRPEPYFYMFKMDVRLLKHLSEVHRRKASKKRVEDTNVQRGYDEKRAKEINRFIEGGFPWSTLNEKDKEQSQYQNLKMPGLLPTAIVANILGSSDRRGRETIKEEDLIKIDDIDDDLAYINLPDSVFEKNWNPELKPLEIIDGQHRLMAFDETEDLNGNFEVPVVAFYNLDRAWQAYLFYVINIKPKKINTSLGYDLYPLLRTQEWLENSKDGLVVYRESRAQELVEALWLYEGSPWRDRINMLGESGKGNISQAAFIRALTDSYLKRSPRKDISGLFADVLIAKNFEEIRWIRAQQAAFLILLWEQIALSVSGSNQEWAKKLKKEQKQLLLFDTTEAADSAIQINDAFFSKNSMLSKDQGVTGILMFSNDFFFVVANYFEDFDFNSIEWQGDIDEREIAAESIDEAISQIRNNPLYNLIRSFAEEITLFDWRSATAEFDKISQQETQKKYKGSGGYRDIWNGLLEIFKKSHNTKIRQYALKIETLN